jgi:cobalt-zinc-cadmium efflux system membrane fusion protein
MISNMLSAKDEHSPPFTKQAASTQSARRLAQLFSKIRRSRESLSYAAVAVALLSVTILGAKTHWAFGLVGSGESPASSGLATAQAHDSTDIATSEVAGASRSHDLRFSDARMHKAGIEVEPATSRRLKQTVLAPGTVDYNHDAVARLAARVRGQVWRVEKRVGQPIAKGDVLAIIESIAVGEAKTELLQAIVLAELKSKTSARLKSVSDSVAERDLREAEAASREARMRLLAASQTLVSLGLPVKLEELEAHDDIDLARKIQFLGLPETVRQGLDPNQTTSNLIPMFAPFDGLVIGRAITLGELVNPDEPHFTVADVNRMWVLLEVRKEDAGLVRIGQPLEFRADGVPAPVEGTVDWISTEMDPKTRTLTVRAIVPNPVIETPSPNDNEQRLLRANTFGTGRIVVRDEAQAVMVPNEAVHYDGAKHFVFVREGELFCRRDVRTGAIDGGQTEIVSGLASGQQVATDGSHVLKAEAMILASH